MSKFLARLFICLASYLTTLGNFWFTYGIWPRSWASFLVFSTISIAITAAYLALQQEDK